MQARSTVRPAILTLGAGLLAAGVACTSSRVIHRDELRPGDNFGRTVVFLQGGAEYRFVRVAVYPDTVVGEYEVTVARSSRAGSDADPGVHFYEEETHAHRMALAAVDSVAEVRRDNRKTALYAAGLLGVGLVLYKTLDSKGVGDE